MKFILVITMLVLFNLSCFTNINHVYGSNDHEKHARKPYIVYMGEKPKTLFSHTTAKNQHHSLLSEAIGDASIAAESTIYNYGRSFNGFAANLLPHEAKRLMEKGNVISVFPNKVRKLHTTRSWDFLGLPLSATRNKKIESNLVIGMLDTGVWVDSPCFNDTGYGPPPSNWKGDCRKDLFFSGCNNKIIGASYFNLNKIGGPTDVLSPTDTNGHGTHTSSTAAGVPVPGASLYGLAKGTARGGAYSARLAMYKVCWEVGCNDMDILAGFDSAIDDGVDIISVSLGADSTNFLEDPIAIGSFHAMKKGIFTSCSGGNSGPELSTVENVAPWVMTVAASSIDRQFKTNVKLGNGKLISGTSINTFSPEKQMYPLTNGAKSVDWSHSADGLNVSACDKKALSPFKVTGKIVHCVGNNGEQPSTIDSIGGLGTILSDDKTINIALSYSGPASVVSNRDGRLIDNYINTATNAKAVIYKSKTTSMDAPFVASFSSRGPQTITPNILKPDVAAPGLSILAGFSPVASVSGSPDDTRTAMFNIVSGTSMACPHVSGAAAYVKSFHPAWSPAAIKSALMTTATPMKVKQEETELGAGSGQINPTKAVDPGLIYDLTENSYISFLCKEGYNSTALMMLTGKKSKDATSCSNYKEAKGSDGLNYPSLHFQMPLASSSKISAVFYRTVTNVGDKEATYKAEVKSLSNGMYVKVEPDTLMFNEVNQKKSFKVSVQGMLERNVYVKVASLVWSDSQHFVTSPVVISRQLHY